MTRVEKTIEKMRNNPRDWRIADLTAIASRYGIAWRQNGTSHVQFVRNDGVSLTAPAHRPIKPVYVQKFLVFIEVYL